MKYLDEQIVVVSSTSIATAPTGVYQYRVMRKNDTNNTYSAIFIGSLYHTYNTIFRVDITDVIRNDVWIPYEETIYSSNDITAQRINLVNTYRVDFYTDTTSYSSSSDVQVAKVYRYPHILSDMTDDVFFNYATAINTVSFPLQGRYSKNRMGYFHLMPRYPYIKTSNYKMILVSEDSIGFTDYTLHLRGNLIATKNITFTPPATLTTYKLSSLFNNLDRNTVTGSFGTFHAASSHKFNITTTTNGIYIQSNNQVQTYLYCMLVQVDSNGNITKRFTNWMDWDEVLDYNITIASDFNSANSNGYIRMILSQTNSGTPTSINSYDNVEYHFGIDSATVSDLVGKTVSVTIVFYEDDWMASWTFDNFNMTTPVLPSDTLLEIAGDYLVKIDMDCISRYYLQWQDRMGAFQSQPFNEHYTYSENVERETITDYRGVKRVSEVNVTPKFKINTDWIKEDLYPYYESIFTSPVLFLYDTHEDKRYSVLVTDSEYTEKTYKNQKKMFNLTLNLELNQQQKIIY